MLAPELRLLWVLHFASVAFMTGLIWLVQLVHYPLMNRVDRERFVDFHAAHSSRITLIVAPVMVVELLSALGLVLQSSSAALTSHFPSLLARTCLAMSIGVFASTAFLSVPEHGRLRSGFDEESHERLVKTNTVRTILWSVHLLICIWAMVAPGRN